MNDLANSCGGEIQSKLKWAMMLSFAILILEIVGGYLSNSLALLSDAGHVLMDVLAIGLSFYASILACRRATTKTSYGMHRFEIFAALINGITLIVLSLLIFYQAYQRIISPPAVKGTEMFLIAVVGLVGNLAVMLKLGGGHKNLNVRSAYLHILGDTVSSVAVVCGGVLIIFTGIYIIDPLLSILIGALIIIGSIRLLRESINILMENAPKSIDITKVSKEICSIDGVKEVHDVHVWSICSNVHLLTAHVSVDSIHLEETKGLIKNINNRIQEKFGILHTTLQFECFECENSHIH